MANRKRLLIIILTAVGLLVAAVVAGYFLLPRLLGADEEVIAKTMPEETAVFLELNLLNLQNTATRDLSAAWAESYTEADIPFNESDPSTLLNILDEPLHEMVGMTVSEDVRPWIGLNIGLGILPAKSEAEAPGWLVATTIRDKAGADAFLEKLSANIAEQGAVLIANHPYRPVAQRDDNLLLIASDEAVLAQAVAAQDGLSLADSQRFQQTLAELPEESGLTLFGEADSLLDWLSTAVPADNAGYVEAGLGILPGYTAVGLAGLAVPEGIQLEMVGFHDELNAEQLAWLSAQTTSTLDTNLPENTAVFFNGHRLDLIWQQLKGSLAGLGYTEADVDESMEIFTNLLGFNPDSDLLATLDGEYAVAVIPSEANLSPVVILEHDDPDTLSTQIDSLSLGLRLLGLTASKSDNIYELTDPNGEKLLNFAQFEEGLLLGLDQDGITAVAPQAPALAENELYQKAWASFPENAVPTLFLNLQELSANMALNTAVNIQPITHAALATHSDEHVAKATVLFFVESNLD